MELIIMAGNSTKTFNIGKGDNLRAEVSKALIETINHNNNNMAPNVKFDPQSQKEEE